MNRRPYTDRHLDNIKIPRGRWYKIRRGIDNAEGDFYIRDDGTENTLLADFLKGGNGYLVGYPVAAEQPIIYEPKKEG